MRGRKARRKCRKKCNHGNIQCEDIIRRVDTSLTSKCDSFRDLQCPSVAPTKGLCLQGSSPLAPTKGLCLQGPSPPGSYQGALPPGLPQLKAAMFGSTFVAAECKKIRGLWVRAIKEPTFHQKWGSLGDNRDNQQKCGVHPHHLHNGSAPPPRHPGSPWLRHWPTLSYQKMVLKTRFLFVCFLFVLFCFVFCQKAQNFMVRNIRLCLNFTSMWYKQFYKEMYGETLNF